MPAIKVPRHRFQNVDSDKGLMFYNGIFQPQGVATTELHVIDDLTGPGDCDDLFIAHYQAEGGRIWHDVDLAGTGFFGYLCEMLHSVNNQADMLAGMGKIPSAGAAATEAAARTNPSRPNVDIVSDFLQLPEMLHLLWNAGKNLIQDAGRANLAYDFGVKPVVEDMYKLLDFQQRIDRRVKELKRLVSKGGLRRTITTGTDANAYVANWVTQSNGVFISVPARAVGTTVQRVHCRWVPAEGISAFESPAAMRKLAKRAVYGSTLDLKTMWDIIPFTWLVDWFTNIGKYLAASRGVVPATLATCVVMVHSRTEWSSDEYSRIQNGKPLVQEAIRVIRETKSRTSVSPTLDAHFPLLDGEQKGILASLMAAKIKYR